MNQPSGEFIEMLAVLLGVPVDIVREGVASFCSPNGYSSWKVPKGNGRRRFIDSPKAPLKQLQKLILKRLLYRAPISPFAHGFVPGRSIVTNACVHSKTANETVQIDLEDAYPSVSTRRVYNCLEWGLGRYVKDRFPNASTEERQTFFGWLADICTHNNCLPQGAPTSGMLLNLASARIDRLSSRLVRNRIRDVKHLKYSRYADDLTFTSSEPIPKDFVEEVILVVLRSGFRVNRRKTEHYGTLSRDIVICGVRLRDGKLLLPRKTLRRYRSLFHKSLRYESHQIPATLQNQINGTLGLLTMVTATCPIMLEKPLQRMLERHSSWLNAAKDNSMELRWMPYAS